MKKVLSVRVDDGLSTKVEKLDESKSEVVSKALTSYFLQLDDQQQSKQLPQFSDADIKEILAIMRGLSEIQSSLFTRTDDMDKKLNDLEGKFFSLERKFFDATM